MPTGIPTGEGGFIDPRDSGSGDGGGGGGDGGDGGGDAPEFDGPTPTPGGGNIDRSPEPSPEPEPSGPAPGDEGIPGAPRDDQPDPQPPAPEPTPPPDDSAPEQPSPPPQTPPDGGETVDPGGGPTGPEEPTQPAPGGPPPDQPPEPPEQPPERPESPQPDGPPDTLTEQGIEGFGESGADIPDEFIQSLREEFAADREGVSPEDVRIDRGEIREQAREAEQDVLRDFPGLEGSLGTVAIGIERRGGEFVFVPEISGRGREQIQERRVSDLERFADNLGVDLQPPARDTPAGMAEGVDEAIDTGRQPGGAGAGIPPEQARELERETEQAVGAARAERIGLFNPDLRQPFVESTDLTRGQDFTIERQRTAEGAVFAAELTDEFTRQFVGETVEFSTNLERGEDFSVVLGPTARARRAEQRGIVNPTLRAAVPAVALDFENVQPPRDVRTRSTGPTPQPVRGEEDFTGTGFAGVGEVPTPEPRGPGGGPDEFVSIDDTGALVDDVQRGLRDAADSFTESREELFSPPPNEPTFSDRAFRAITFGAGRAPASGPVDRGARNVLEGFFTIPEATFRGAAGGLELAQFNLRELGVTTGDTLDVITAESPQERRVAQQRLRERRRERGRTTRQAIETGLEETAEFARERPAFFAGSLGGAVAAGVTAGVGIERGAGFARGLRVRRQADVIVDLEDVTTARGVEGDLPLFETSPGAPTSVAVREVRERAADQPESLQDVAGQESLLFRSEDEPLPGEFTAERGRFELPGLFAAPDLSPLRLQEGAATGLSSLRPRLPRISGEGDQVTLFPGERIRGMPDRARGAGFAFDESGERIPDPTTSGAQFLTEEAEPGTAFVRPPGSRSTELEAIFPPGSGFTETGEFGVRMSSGRLVPGRAFRRAGDVDVEDVDDVIPAADIPETRLTRRRPGGAPTAPAFPSFGIRPDVDTPRPSATGRGVSPAAGGLTATGAFETTAPGSARPTAGVSTGVESMRGVSESGLTEAFESLVPPESVAISGSEPVSPAPTSGGLSIVPETSPTPTAPSRPPTEPTGTPTSPFSPGLGSAPISVLPNVPTTPGASFPDRRIEFPEGDRDRPRSRDMFGLGIINPVATANELFSGLPAEEDFTIGALEEPFADFLAERRSPPEPDTGPDPADVGIEILDEDMALAADDAAPIEVLDGKGDLSGFAMSGGGQDAIAADAAAMNSGMAMGAQRQRSRPAGGRRRARSRQRSAERPPPSREPRGAFEYSFDGFGQMDMAAPDVQGAMPPAEPMVESLPMDMQLAGAPRAPQPQGSRRREEFFPGLDGAMDDVAFDYGFEMDFGGF